MAVYKSDIVTNEDNLNTQNPSGTVTKTGAFPKFTASGALSDNDVILMMRVGVDDFIDSIKLFSDDLGDTGDINIGFYPGDGSGVTIAAATDAVDEDAIGSAIDVNNAALANSEVRFETKDHTSVNQRVWELAGLSTKPSYGVMYLAITLSEVTTAGGDLAMKVSIRRS